MSITSNNAEAEGHKNYVGEEHPNKPNGTWQQLTTVMRNTKSRTAYNTKNAKEAYRMNRLQSEMTACKKNFGVAYMDLLMNDASVTELEACVTKAVEDLTNMKTKIVECEEIIAYNKERVKQKIAARRGELDPNHSQPQQPSIHEEGPFTTDPIHLIDNGHKSVAEEFPNSESAPVSNTSTKAFSQLASSPHRCEDTLANTTMTTDDSQPFDEATPDTSREEESNRSNLSHPTPSAPYQLEIEEEVESCSEEDENEVTVGANEVEWARDVERPPPPPLEPTIY